MDKLPSSVDAFSKRASLVGQLFDSKGIVDRMRTDHKLIRCFVRQLSKKVWLIDTTITEKNDVTNHLKSMMLTYPTISSLVCNLGDMDNLDKVEKQIDFILTEQILPDTEDSLIVEGGDKRLDRTFVRLCSEPRIYDFIDKVERENPKKYLVISERDGNYAIDRSRSWYDKIFLGTERKEVIDFLLGHGFTLWNENQQSFRDKYGDYQGYRVWIKKDMDCLQNFAIEFHQCGNARFLIKKEQKNVWDLFPNATDHDYEEWLKIDEIPASNACDSESILAKADEIESRIKDFKKEKELHEDCQL